MKRQFLTSIFCMSILCSLSTNLNAMKSESSKSNQSVLNSEELFKRGCIYYKQDKLELAEKYYLLAIEEGSIDALLDLAYLYHEQNRLGLDHQQNKLDLAEKYYLLAAEKGNSIALNNLGILYKDQNKLDLAEKYFLLAFKKGNTEASNNLGYIYYEQNKLELAEKYFLIGGAEKEDIHALNHLGNLYHKQGKLDLAEKYFLLSVEQGAIEDLNTLGYIYFKQNKLDLAEKYFLLSVEKGAIDALNNLGLLYQTQSKLDLAEKYFLLAIKNGNIHSLNRIGVVYFKQNKLDLAEKYFLLAIEKGDRRDGVLFNLGLCYYKQGKLELAEKYLLLASQNGNQKAQEKLQTLLHLAVKSEDSYKKVCYLLRKGAIKSINLMDNHRRIPLAIAAYEMGKNKAIKDLKVIKLLIFLGADPSGIRSEDQEIQYLLNNPKKLNLSKEEFNEFDELKYGPRGFGLKSLTFKPNIGDEGTLEIKTKVERDEFGNIKKYEEESKGGPLKVRHNKE